MNSELNNNKKTIENTAMLIKHTKIIQSILLMTCLSFTQLKIVYSSEEHKRYFPYDLTDDKEFRQRRMDSSEDHNIDINIDTDKTYENPIFEVLNFTKFDSDAVSEITTVENSIPCQSEDRNHKTTIRRFRKTIGYGHKSKSIGKHDYTNTKLHNPEIMSEVYEKASNFFTGKITVALENQQNKKPLPSLVAISANLPDGLKNYFDETVLAYENENINKFLLVHESQYKEYQQQLDEKLRKNSVTLANWNHEKDKVGFGLSRRAACILGKNTSTHTHVLMSDDTVKLDKEMLDEAYKIYAADQDSSQLLKYAALGHTYGDRVNPGKKTFLLKQSIRIGQSSNWLCYIQIIKLMPYIVQVKKM